jgi:hypothetical protein
MLGTLRLINDRRIFGDSDIAIGINLSFHEGDGGDMAFTDSPEADDKPYHTLSVLHGMWDDGRIEKCGGFQCILLGEERSNEPFILIGQLHIRRDAVFNVSVMFQEYLLERLRRYFYPFIDTFENKMTFTLRDREYS